MTGHNLCADQVKAIKAIAQCRTAALGGHIDKCGQCGHQKVSYNSCRNRHCPKCQYLKQAIWVDKLQSKLPVCRYFHLVFTVPQPLHKLFYINQSICYGLLLKAAATALDKVGRNPKFLGAQTGAVAVLHTWGQALTYHPHVHMVVPAGGLSPDGTQWVQAPKKFFLPVRVLSRVFRGVMWGLVKQNLELGKLRTTDQMGNIPALKAQLYAKNWNVFAKKTMAGPQTVVRYLGNYTHRVAITNNRIVGSAGGKVAFNWKNYRNNSRRGTLTLTAHEFIKRFLWHILPSGFYKVRYYGLLAAANVDKRDLCNALLGKPLPVPLLQGISMYQALKVVTAKDPAICPRCKKGVMVPFAILEPG